MTQNNETSPVRTAARVYPATPKNPVPAHNIVHVSPTGQRTVTSSTGERAITQPANQLGNK